MQKLRLSLVVTAIVASGCSSLEPLVVYSHVSDPTVGNDITVDFLGAGGTLTTFDGALEVDAALGRKSLMCDIEEGCSSTWGALFDVKWRPRRVGGR